MGQQVVSAEVPSDNQLFWVSLGDDQIKRTLPFLNEVLRQIVTLSTALMGGSIAFLKDDMLRPVHLKTFALLFFMASLVSAFVGVLPRSDYFTPRCPEEIEEVTKAATTWKLNCVRLATLFTGVGLAMIIIGVFLKTFSNSP